MLDSLASIPSSMLPFAQEYAWTSCCLIVLLCAAFYKSRKAPWRFPPGSEGLPIVGNLATMGGNAERVLAQWGWRIYGPVFYVKVGATRVVVLNTFEAAQEGFLKKGDCLSGRFGGNNGSGSGAAFPDYTPRWKEQRKSRINALKNFEKQDVEAVIAQEADLMCEDLAAKLEANGEASFLPAEHTTLPTFNIVSMVVCGFPIQARADRDELLNLLMEPIYNQHCRGVFSCPYAAVGSEGPSFLTGPGRASQRKRTDLVLRHIRSAEGRNFVNGFHARMRRSSVDGDGGFDEKQLTGYVTDLFLAGTDTMATAVAWTVVMLAADRKRQKRLQDEIAKMVGDKAPCMADFDRMHYARAVAQEVFRMRPVFPLSISHKSTSEVYVQGFRIPKDTTVISNLWAIHNDAKHWHKPEKFKPERHLNDSGEFVKSERVIPFSIGPRYCLGGQLATMQHFLFTTRLLQKFTFRLEAPEASETDLRGVTSVVLAPRGVRVRAEAR